MAIAVGAAAGAVQVGVLNPNRVGYVANTASAAATLSATSMVAGTDMNVVNMTGSLSGGAALTIPTVAALMAAKPGGAFNSTSLLRIVNNSAGNFAWTLTAGASESVSGTATVAQNTSRDFRLQFINGTSVVATNVGSAVN